MRTRIYYPFIQLIALLTTVSCENELPFNVKDNPPQTSDERTNQRR